MKGMVNILTDSLQGSLHVNIFNFTSVITNFMKSG